MSKQRQAVLEGCVASSTGNLSAILAGDPPLQSPKRIAASTVAQKAVTDEALQLLTRRLLDAQEEERRNVARELHDGLNQTLAMLGVEVDLALHDLPTSARTARRQLLRVRTGLEQVSENVRQISHRLHPAVLEHIGLVPALRSCCSEFANHQQVAVLFVREGTIEQIPLQVAVCLYRIVQEALRNAAKYAGATEIIVSLIRRNGEMKLSVADDGRGFDVMQVRHTSGLGLVSMEERARIVGGRLSINSCLGAGTRIEIVVPAGRHPNGHSC